MKDIKALCDQVRQVAYDIHVFHGHGHLEKVYENALVHRLRKVGIDVKQQYPLMVYDEDGTIIGDYLADLFVENTLIVELKTAKTLAPEHEGQILGYLKSSRTQHGLLINSAPRGSKYGNSSGRNSWTRTNHKEGRKRKRCFLYELCILCGEIIARRAPSGCGR